MASEEEIREIVNRETHAWDTKDVKLLMTIFHPDMVWPWPQNSNAHDPMDWIFEAGRYNYERWTKNWQSLFDTHNLIYNHRHIRKILIAPEQDGALAVVDVDTLWQDMHGNDFHWKGRACKVYAKIHGEWKMTMHTGLLNYNGLNKFSH
jgi:hypothetical protein